MKREKLTSKQRNIKIFLILSSLFGVTISLLTAKQDGYTYPIRRLLYFTALSNIWVGLNTLFLVIFRSNHKLNKRYYRMRYYSVIAITMTGLIFCFLLAPFADSSYKAWTLSNLFTHVVTPILAVFDYFSDYNKFNIDNKITKKSLIPPAIYFTVVAIIGTLGFDFGRGANYPYFFVNIKSPSGTFGFSKIYPYYMGSAYWFIILTTVYYLIAKTYKIIGNYLYNKKVLSPIENNRIVTN